LPEDGLVRLAQSPEGVLTPDVAAKLPGRGVWVTATRAAVELAAKRGGFARGLKGPVAPVPDLVDQIEAALVRRCLGQLGLARRAGALALGFDSTVAALRASKAYLLLEASDGSADGREKTLGPARRDGVFVAGCFTAEELGVALGRDRVVHACLLQERLARRLAVDLGRLAGFRALTPPDWYPPGE
jgi:predicted RNA-binding protein YlxR (DUF448 family)/ribosomal protein L30E